MRIRLSGDKAILTVKESSTLLDGIQRSNESEEVLSHATAESILAGSIPATHNRYEQCARNAAVLKLVIASW